MEEKKTIWDFLDKYLPPAVGAYGKLRQQTTGIDPFAPKQEDVPVQNLVPPEPEQPKKSKIPLIVGGVVVLGIATYFITRKFKKNG